MFVVLLKSMLFPCNMEEEEPMTHDEIVKFYQDPKYHKDFKIWISQQPSTDRTYIYHHLHKYSQTWEVHLKQYKSLRASIEHFKNIQIEMKQMNDDLENMQQEFEVEKRDYNANLANNASMKQALQHAINAFRHEREKYGEVVRRDKYGEVVPRSEQ